MTDHNHRHHHHHAPSGDRAVLVAVVINIGLTVAQIVGGLLSGSLALIADAIHNLSDAISLVIAYGAEEWGSRWVDTVPLVIIFLSKG